MNAETAYLFRHALLRDGAYPSTRKAKRRWRFAFARTILSERSESKGSAQSRV